MGSLRNMDMSPGMHPRGEVDVSLNAIIMVDGRSRINDNVISNHGIRIHHRPGEHHDPPTQPDRWGDGRPRVNRLGWRQTLLEHFVEHVPAKGIIANCDDELRKSPAPSPHQPREILAHAQHGMSADPPALEPAVIVDPPHEPVPSSL